MLRRLDQWTLRQLAELADAFARVRARHTLLLDVVPSRCEKAIPSVEVLFRWEAMNQDDVKIRYNRTC